MEEPAQFAQRRIVEDCCINVRCNQHGVVEHEFTAACVVTPDTSARRERGGSSKETAEGPQGFLSPLLLADRTTFPINARYEQRDLQRAGGWARSELLAKVVHWISMAFLYWKSRGVDVPKTRDPPPPLGARASYGRAGRHAACP